MHRWRLLQWWGNQLVCAKQNIGYGRQGMMGTTLQEDTKTHCLLWINDLLWEHGIWFVKPKLDHHSCRVTAVTCCFKTIFIKLSDAYRWLWVTQYNSTIFSIIISSRHYMQGCGVYFPHSVKCSTFSLEIRPPQYLWCTSGSFGFSSWPSCVARSCLITPHAPPPISQTGTQRETPRITWDDDDDHDASGFRMGSGGTVA